MKRFKYLLLTLATITMCGAAISISTNNDNASVKTEATSYAPIKIYIDINFATAGQVRIPSNGSFKDFTLVNESNGKYLVYDYADSDLTSINMYFKENSVFWHPYVSDTYYSDNSTIYGNFKKGFEYKITYSDCKHDGGDHKWFTYQVEEIGSISTDFKPSGFYVFGSFNGGTTAWNVQYATPLVQINESNYSYSVRNDVTLNYGDRFEIAYYDGNGNWNQYHSKNSIQDDSPAKYCFGSFSDSNNIVCYASGTYSFYFHQLNGESNKTLYISLVDPNTINAQQLAAKLMSFGTPDGLGYESSDACKGSDKYPSCLSMFNSLSEGEQDAFIAYKASSTDQFKNAYDRMLAWSKANNLKDDAFRVKAISAEAIYGAYIGVGNSIVNFSSESAPIIIIVISATSMVALLGLYISQKKKRNY